jgi:hypothetical protein
VVVAALTAATAGDPVRGIRSAVVDPSAVRGGVLMVPLQAQRPGDRWPATITVQFDDGRKIQGTVAWLQPAPIEPDAGWTVDPGGLVVRPVEPADDTSRRGVGTPVLLVRLPDDGSGSLDLDGQTLQPTWWSAPPRPTQERMRRASRLDRPDPLSPFEHWRWALLGERLDMAPPAPDDLPETGALVAEHLAGLWHVGLARLAAVSPAVADRCRDLLTRICRDGYTDIAAWVSNPAQTSALLSILLDRRRSDRALQRDAQAWTDAQDPLLPWIESDHGDAVSMAIINRGEQPIVARFAWLTPQDIPIAMELAPGELTPVRIDRPRGDGSDPGEAVLVVSAGGRERRLPVAPGLSIALPPAAFQRALRPPVTLADLETGRRRTVEAERSTEVQLRRRQGRWEIFFDCRRPSGAARPGAAVTVEPRRSLEPGIEAVAVDLGASPTAATTLIVPEHGPPSRVGLDDDGTLEVHRRSLYDRWYCRIVLPDAWLPPAGEPLSLACRRAHGDHAGIDHAPRPTSPWRAPRTRSAIDLGQWDDRPGG